MSLLNDGKSLTLISLSTLASTNGPLLPSSMKTAYPEIGHPPLFKGSFHLIVIVEVVVEILLGALKPEGLAHGTKYEIEDWDPAPLKL